MSLRDHLRRWLRRNHRDTPLTLTDEQRDMVTRAIHQMGVTDLTRHLFSADFTLDHGLAVDAEQIAADFRRVGRDIAAATWTAHPVDRFPPRSALSFGVDAAGDATFTGGYHDPRPDYCWRCDALPASDPIIGLCHKCATDLKADD